MEVEPEEVPSQIKDVLGMLVEYGALSGNAQKRPKRMLEAFLTQQQRGPAQGDELPCQLVLRHDRELNSLQRQNTYILFLSTGPDSPSQCSMQSGQPVTETMSDADSGANPAATSQKGEGARRKMHFQPQACRAN